MRFISLPGPRPRVTLYEIIALVHLLLALPLLTGALARAGALDAHAPAVPVDSLAGHPERDPDSGVEMLGRPAPGFRFARWLDGPPLELDALRGRVVLVRFWTDDCSYCRNTLPAIDLLRREYGAQGLVVIGAYHPHEPHPVRDAFVRRWAKRLGFGGPVAVDEDWRTLSHWWLDGHPERNWVSVSFLVDRAGNVRWVQGGGEYHPSAEASHHACEVRYDALEATVRTLLAEPATRGGAIRERSSAGS